MYMFTDTYTYIFFYIHNISLKYSILIYSIICTYILLHEYIFANFPVYITFSLSDEIISALEN